MVAALRLCGASTAAKRSAKAAAAAADADAGASQEDAQDESDDDDADADADAAPPPAAATAAARRPGRLGRFGVPPAEEQATRAARADATTATATALPAIPLPPVLAEDPLPPGLHVIVIGAGVSGLRAALELERAGAVVTVLEARARIGGRIHTESLSCGADERPVDLGASFVCGTSRTPPLNPVFSYAVGRLGLTLRPKEREGPKSNAWFADDGTAIPAPALRTAEAAYTSLLERLLGAGSRAALPKEITVGAAVNRLLSEAKLEPAPERLVRAYLSDLYVAPVENISLRGAVSYGYEGSHELVSGGYKQVVDALAAGKAPDDVAYARPLADVRLSHVVSRVVLPPGGGRVAVTARRAGDATDTVLRAHAVLVTLPLGVLQRRCVAFTPPLPPYKQAAIDALGMGTENRVAMLFPSLFWPGDVFFLRPESGRYTYSNLHALGVERVLCAWVRPDAVAEVEALSDADALADVLSQLRRMFPDGFVDPSAHVVTRWASDPFSYGSYSFVPPTGSVADYDRLAVPVSGDAEIDAAAGRALRPGGGASTAATRLFFGGEATHRADAYTVHGAFMSGAREAAKIKAWWRDHSEAALGAAGAER
jgi:monoamine oxidase